MQDDADTKTRLIRAMLQALATRGYHGTGLSDVLATANAPKGVLYHHFPGGKVALAVAAVEAGTAQMCARLNKHLRIGDHLGEAISNWLAYEASRQAQSGFALGCPLATIALESAPEDEALRAALSSSFAQVRATLATVIAERTGRSMEAAQGLSALIVAAYEGGLMQARVAQSEAPLRAALKALLPLLEAA
jgi:TetR/AcrR family transcriptional regulator, lmrAB and yxaGH operons repressor